MQTRCYGASFNEQRDGYHIFLISGVKFQNIPYIGTESFTWYFIKEFDMTFCKCVAKTLCEAREPCYGYNLRVELVPQTRRVK